MLAETFNTLRMFTRFATGLRPFLRSTVTLEDATTTVSGQLLHRDRSFLSLIQDAVFGNPRSPYLALMRMAGCEFGDLDTMVRKDGLESSLETLAQRGVWVGFDEFKGRRPVIRGSWTYEPSSSDFDNPLSTGILEASSGGSTGHGIRTAYDFTHISRARTAYKLLTFAAWNVHPFPVVMWSPVAPGYGPLELLAHARAGKVPRHWFTPVKQSQAGGTTRDRLLNSLVPYASRLTGNPLPSPVYAGPDDAEQVACAIEALRDAHGGCIVLTDPSGAVRVCSDSMRRSATMDGVLFIVGGEPITGLKREIIERAGAACSPLYVFIEGGYVAIGCLNPHHADDMHLLSDSIAMVQHEHYVAHAGTSVKAFLVTTLLRTTPKLLLNVQPGDYGEMEQRQCDCPLGRLGFNRHVSHVRSFDKLTSSGMSVMASCLLRIVEDVLPAKYGGSLLDYQLVEEETGSGVSHITLMVDPDVGTLDETALVGTVLDELRAEGKPAELAGQLWAASGTIDVRRERPSVTARGKLLPLDIRR